MKLDLRRPTLVITGAWNPPIFQPPWAAKHLFGVPEGDQIRVNQMIRVGPSEPLAVSYIDDVGYRVAQSRVEIYVNAMERRFIRNCEEVCVRLLESLPHTPIRAFGVNFFFVEDDPSDLLLDSLQVTDSLAEEYQILSQELKASIPIDNDCELNLTRQPSGSSVVFNFNFHHENFSELNRVDTVTGSVDKYFGMALELLRNTYSLIDVEILAHEFGGLENDRTGEIQE